MSVKGVSLVYLDAREESDRIEAAQSGDRESYLRLVRQYQRPLYRAAYSMTRDPARAETLTRDVFVRAWQRLHDFPRGQRFFPWLLRAARGLFPTPQTVPSSARAAVAGPVPTDTLAADQGPTRTLETDASGTGPTGADATGADAPGADATGADAPGAEATGADATGADAPGADATGTDETSADANGSDAGWAGAGVPSVSPETMALAAFSELRPDEQMALSMRLLERITYEEIGAILDLSLGVVTLRMSQARGHLLPRAETLPREPEPA